ncbi:class I SAM-dependent methyltransferase [Candidatus Woesearchaeota archaeon]|nr:class I SAM-dependent methyltransferase [Candidatus Woesearchaeota archaeon]
MRKKSNIRGALLKIAYNSPLERNLNLILRYDPIARMLGKIAGSGKKQLKVLEIGSGTIGITRFYKGKVVGIDIATESYMHPRLKFMKASATNLPFKDRSFDVVISVDTLEHLSRKDQLKMVQEAYRVAKKHILLTYPVGFNKYQERIIKKWKKSHLTESLKEHLRGGTAKGNEVEKSLKGKKYKLIKMDGIHPLLAYYLSYLEQNAATRLLSRTLLKFFLPLLKIPKGTARRYFFVEK